MEKMQATHLQQNIPIPPALTPRHGKTITFFILPVRTHIFEPSFSIGKGEREKKKVPHFLLVAAAVKVERENADCPSLKPSQLGLFQVSLNGKINIVTWTS